jgi:hypothetical protein
MKTWYHGTVAELVAGDLIVPGGEPNFEASDPRRVYFTPDMTWAAFYAVNVSRAGGDPHVYEVSPTASRTFRDFSLMVMPQLDAPAVYDPRARWSCQPLTVLREVQLTIPCLRKVAGVVGRIEESLEPAGGPDGH